MHIHSVLFRIRKSDELHVKQSAYNDPVQV